MEKLSIADRWFSAVLFAALTFYTVIQSCESLPSGSMRETIWDGDLFTVNRLIYGVRNPFTDTRIFKWRKVRRGDVVIFDIPSAAREEVERAEHEHGVHADCLGKRVVGLP